jgi:two-component system sensor histidine kinase DesK
VSALESLHRYTRLTLFGTIPLAGGFPFLFAVRDRVAPLPVALLAAVTAVLLTVHWRHVREAIADPAAVRPWRPVVFWLVVATAVAGWALALTVNGDNVLWAFLPSMFVAELQYGRAPAQAWGLAGVCAAVVGVVAVVTTGDSGTEPAVFAAAVLVTAGIPFAELLALRQWRLALELDQARRDAAELGATRERLRFAEDLHDILGHALEVVSLKSELATRLGPVDPDRAHAEMAEVQRLARGALKDVRDLVRGRRPIDLATELAGARTLLESAGIECVVDVEPATEPAAGAALEPAAGARHSELLGRVLREAVTNLLRHADTRRCWVTVRPAALSVVNDGVTGAPPGDGTGLAALARRVAAADGVFTAGPGERPGTFAVSAVLR